MFSMIATVSVVFGIQASIDMSVEIATSVLLSQSAMI
ncbi:hypothetical protein Sbal678_4048 [Shewanella baltica OS678]|nr:hypothetical protein Sbal678_4048 [Shewanella baltica OS678]